MRSMFFLARAMRSAWMRAKAEAFGRPDQNGASDTAVSAAGRGVAAAARAVRALAAAAFLSGAVVVPGAARPATGAAARIRARENCRLRFTLPPRSDVSVMRRADARVPAGGWAREVRRLARQAIPSPVRGSMRTPAGPRAGRGKPGFGRGRHRVVGGRGPS